MATIFEPKKNGVQEPVAIAMYYKDIWLAKVLQQKVTAVLTLSRGLPTSNLATPTTLLYNQCDAQSQLGHTLAIVTIH